MIYKHLVFNYLNDIFIYFISPTVKKIDKLCKIF